MDFGNGIDGPFDLKELLSHANVSPDECTLYHYSLSGDQSLEFDATHIIALNFNDASSGKIFLLDKIIQTPLLLMLGIGNKLKPFHCDNCARNVGLWFLEQQSYWKDKYHEAASPQDGPTKETHH